MEQTGILSIENFQGSQGHFIMANEKEKLILVDKTRNGIATITINRPQALNALTRDMLVTLAYSFTRLDEDPDVKVIILTGAGRAFSAGVVTFLTHSLRREKDLFLWVTFKYGMPLDARNE